VRQALTERVELARRELERVRPGAWLAGELTETTEGRAVVEFHSNGARLIGKLSDAIDGDQTFRRLEVLHASETPTLRVPRPIAWCEGPRVLVTEAAGGIRATDLQPASWGAAMTRFGRALRELHGLALDWRPAMTLADHVRDLVRPAPETLARAFPEHADRIRETLDTLQEMDRAWARIPPVPLHRDFHLRQLFDDGERVTVLDWDDAASGDAAFDVGYFTAYLKTHFDLADAEPGIVAFYAGYGGDEALLARVPVYERFNFLRRAARRYRLQDSGWERELAAMMRRLGD
jgi:aminoglycoside phosphotransferase (APT) family kinase protein